MKATSKYTNATSNVTKLKEIVKLKSYMDLETGEHLQVPIVFHEGTNKDFEMLFAHHLMNVLGQINNSKIKVLEEIISKRGLADNIYIGTNKEIAERTDLTEKTVWEAIRFFIEKDVIQKKTGVIYINPISICDGRFKGRIMHIYQTEQEVQARRAFQKTNENNKEENVENLVEEPTIEERIKFLENMIKGATIELNKLKKGAKEPTTGFFYPQTESEVIK